MRRAAVEASLRAATAALAAPLDAQDAVTLRWGPLFARLDTGDDDGFVEAIELIHEGYLVHYRTGRVAAIDAADRSTALLAGDVLYARGLRLVAARGDVASVLLLTRLMATCSRLRSLSAPFDADDALWAYTMGALAAVRAGVPPVDAAALFDELDGDQTDGAPRDVPLRAAAAAGALGLAHAGPLEAEFASLTSAHPSAL